MIIAKVFKPIQLVILCVFLFFGVTKTFSQTLDIVSDCVTVHDLEVIGVDGTGRNSFINAPMIVNWDMVNLRWIIAYNGTIYWTSPVASSPNPPMNPSEWTNSIAACSSLISIATNEVEICNNGLDDDGDGWMDCDDEDCQVTSFAFTDEAANYVAGQTDFISNTIGTTNSKYNAISDIAVDPISKKVFVSDTWNHRVLRYASVESFLNNEPAESVLGQSNFTSSSQNSGATGMARPYGICVDSEGTLWVADFNNSRVLKFNNAASKSIGAPADGVLGKPDFILGGVTSGASGMWNPIEVLVDDLGTLWVSDYSNRRVLRFDNANLKTNGANADGVLGKPDFITTVGPYSIRGTGMVIGLAMINNSLFVADSNGDRIVRWDNPSTKPNGADMDAVIGQPNFNSGNSGTSSMRFKDPYLMDSDDNGNLFVSDSGNSRILVFGDPKNTEFLEAADFVYGQPDFNSNTVGTSEFELNKPRGVTIINDGNNSIMAISDHFNHRMVGWGYSHVTSELLSYSSVLPAFTSFDNIINFSLGDVGLGEAVVTNATTGAFIYYPPGICPLNRDSIIDMEYTVENGFGCVVTDTISIKVKDVAPCINGSNLGSCNELYPFDWYDGGGNGLQWPISNGEAVLNSGVIVGGGQGDVTIDVRLDNPDGQNIDFSNCGTDGDHFYTATCNDPNASIDCDGDISTTDGQISMGCNFLTLGMTSNNSDELMKLTFDFDHSVKIHNLTVVDLDYEGSSTPSASSWQDEVEIRAFNGVNPVIVSVVGGAKTIVSNNFTTVVKVRSIYDPNNNGNLSPNDVDGHVLISTEGKITSLSIIMSNGPDDDGISDDHVIGISSFNVCPSFDENTVALCSDGIDNDMDGIYDCLDSDCNGLSVCDDWDSDGVSDNFDEDDDNDGLSDMVESIDYIDYNSFRYTHNQPSGNISMDEVTDPRLTDWFLASTSDELPNNLTITPIVNAIKVENFSGNTFEEAFSNAEYIQYDFTTGIDLVNPILNKIRCGMYYGLTTDSYHVAVLLSENNFVSYTMMSKDVRIHTQSGSYVRFELNDFGNYPLISNTNYSVRVYFYLQVDDNPVAHVVWDDFSIQIASSLGGDFDGDSFFNHLDLDSDNDGIHDVIEGGGVDGDNDGVVGIGAITDGNSNGWSSICDPADGGSILPDTNTDTIGNQDRLSIDSDNDGCNDVNEAGYLDSNSDGILGGTPMSTDVKGKVIYTP